MDLKNTKELGAGDLQCRSYKHRNHLDLESFSLYLFCDVHTMTYGDMSN